MNKMLMITFLSAVAFASATEVLDPALDEYLDPRFIYINTSALDLGSAAAGILGALGSVLTLVLFGLLIWLVVSLFLSKFDGGLDSGYGHGGGYSGSSSSYSGYQAR